MRSRKTAVFGALLLILSILSILVVYVLPPYLIRKAGVVLREKTGWRLDVRNVRFNPLGQFRFSDISLGIEENADPLLACETVLVRFSWTDLIKSPPRIDRLEFSGATVNVPPSTAALGLGGKTAGGGKSLSETPLPPLLAETLVVNDARIRFPKPVSLRFLGEVREVRADLSAELDYVSPDLTVNVRTLHIEDAGNDTNGVLKVEGRGLVTTDGERYDIREAVLESPLGHITIQGKPVQFGELDLTANARFTPDGVPSNIELPLWAVPTEIGAEAKGPWDRPSFLAKIRFPSEKAQVEGSILPDTENADSFTVDGMFLWNDLHTWFGRFEGIPAEGIPQGGLRGTFSFNLGSNRPISGHVELSSVDWNGNGDEGFLRELKTAILLDQGEIRLDSLTVDSGFGRAVMHGSWTGAWGEDFHARFRIDLTGSDAFFWDMKIEDASLDLKLDGEAMPFGPVQGSIALALEGFEGAFQDRPSEAVRDVHLDSTISGSFVKPLVQADLSVKKASRGELDLDDIRFDMNWDPDRADDPGEIKGTVGRIRFGDRSFDKNSLNGRFSSDRNAESTDVR